jgi:hypothetical protein
MFPRLSAVIQDVLVGAAGIFEGVGQDRQAVEDAVVVDGLGKTGDRGREPGMVECDRAEGA